MSPRVLRTVLGRVNPDGGLVSTRSNGVVSVDRWDCVLYAKFRGLDIIVSVPLILLDVVLEPGRQDPIKLIGLPILLGW